MDDKQLINESIKVADVLAKELSFWKRLFIYTCSVLLSVLIVFGILAYVYVIQRRLLKLPRKTDFKRNIKLNFGYLC